MKTKELKSLLERAETWPAQTQAELVQAAHDIEAEIGRGRYHLSEDERKELNADLRPCAKACLPATNTWQRS